MRWRLLFVLLLGAAVAGCTFEHRVTPPPETPRLEVEQLDAELTYAVDPRLDALLIDFDCAANTMKLDYGDAVGRMVRDAIGQRFSRAVEVAPELADVSILFEGARYEGEFKQQFWTLEGKVFFVVRLLVVPRGGEPVSVFGSDYVVEEVGAACPEMLEIFDRMSPDVLESLARRVVDALPVPASAGVEL